MSFLFSTVPSPSRMRLVMPLVQALVAEGATVSFLVASELAHLLPPGVTALPVPITMTDVRRMASIDTGFSHLAPDKQALHMFTRTWPAYALQALDCLSVQTSALVVVHEQGDHAGDFIAAALGASRVVVGWPCPTPAQAVQLEIEQRLDECWERYGKRGCSRRQATLFLETNPFAFVSGRTASQEWARLRPVDKPIDRRQVPTWIREMPFDTTVHMTLGTVAEAYNPPSLFGELVAALQQEPLNLVISTGSLPTNFQPCSDSLRLPTHVNHRELLPACSLVVCHGGVSTVAECLAHAIPLVIVPLGGASQMRTAMACEACGVGKVVHPSQFHAAYVRATIVDMLLDPRYVLAGDAMQRAVLSMPSAHRVAAELRDRFGI